MAGLTICSQRGARITIAACTCGCAVLGGCGSIGGGIGLPVFPGVSLGVGVGNGGVHAGVGTGIGPVGIGVGVNQRGRVTGGVGIGTSLPVGSGARIGVGVGSGTVLHEPDDPEARPVRPRRSGR